MINLSKVAKLGLIWVKGGIGNVAHLAAQTNIMLVVNYGSKLIKIYKSSTKNYNNSISMKQNCPTI